MEELKLYPNPTQGLLYIQTGAREVSRLRVIDMHGALVLEQLAEPGSRILEVDLSLQAPGIYYVQVFSEQDYLVKPVIISR